ncbi:bifunctional nuclease family protein [Bacteroidales bacterium OttesenSCG-928-B11]|nr:bifunctional nuclease family protein [Bacteroidales bacterium OttesenSCG-928-E04]MDL2308497.1 bifunctional nuclease family protein [Bacteroidales bacterium OttesenSCG-928-C03]MDL2311418.1 bifunctional nuclease family protein [Bacteroidales bacterium OttesenSCG-928-B11]MDL2325814.1 bifunctional nuclease family protein [Bacteroidales bacterium OttesenSCG-928-A14]
MAEIELKVENIKNSENQSEAYGLILAEKNGNRMMPIMIGWSEARSLVLAMNKVAPRRPTPHDLFVQLSKTCGCELNSVLIYKQDEGIFYSVLRMLTSEGNFFEIDSRTSDAVTIALLNRVPIFVESDIFDKVSYVNPSMELEIDSVINEEITSPEDFFAQQISEMTNSELDSMLEGAIESEDFELASKIHEEKKKRGID